MEGIVKFFYEVGLLKCIKRSGWWVAGIKEPESVAEHSFRTAVIGYVLALLEGADPLRTAALCLIHDLSETRTGDLNRIQRRYLSGEDGERMAFRDQMEWLPQEINEALSSLYQELSENRTKEARLARDADLLECLLQAREYITQGYSSVDEWIENALAGLRSPWAIRLGRVATEVDPEGWWHGLKKFPSS